MANRNEHYVVLVKNQGMETRNVAYAKVTAATAPGKVVVLDTLDAGIEGNLTVFADTAVTAGNIGSSQLALIMRGDYAINEDGTRSEVNMDWTTYTHAAGDVVAALRLEPGLMIEVSEDTVDATGVAVGGYFAPVAATDKLTYTATAVAGARQLKVLAVNALPIGQGFITGETINTYVCVVVQTDAVE